MEDLIGGQFDLKIALRGPQHVAEAEVGHAVDQMPQRQEEGAARDLLVEHALIHLRVHPARDRGGIKTDLLDGIAAQDVGER